MKYQQALRKPASRPLHGKNLIWTGIKCVKCDAMYSPLLP